MSLKHTVISTTQNAAWVKELETLLATFRPTFGAPDAQILLNADEASETEAPLVFVDGHLPDLDAALAAIPPAPRAIFLVMKEDFRAEAPVPQALLDGRAHDVLVYPFRPLEVLGKLRMYQQILALGEVQELNESLSEVLARLKDDLQLTERLQLARLKPRYPQIKGLKVHTRYLAGLKSGGDFFDLAEVKSETGLSPISFVLTDSSTYGLSSLVMGVLVRVVMKLAGQDALSALQGVERIRQELATLMGEKDKLSLFYGVLSRRELKLRYVSLGTMRAYHAPNGGEFALLPGHPDLLTAQTQTLVAREHDLALNPQDRFVLLSDGFVDACGGDAKALKALNALRDEEPKKLLNELAYTTKATLTDDDMPAQDCTGVVLDLEGQKLRLA